MTLAIPDLLLQLVDEFADPVPVLLVLLRLELELLDAPLALGAVLRVVRRHLHGAGQLEVKLQRDREGLALVDLWRQSRQQSRCSGE